MNPITYKHNFSSSFVPSCQLCAHAMVIQLLSASVASCYSPRAMRSFAYSTKSSIVDGHDPSEIDPLRV